MRGIPMFQYVYPQPEPERICEQECQGKLRKTPPPSPITTEFVGPVKIVLIESTSLSYQRKVCGSACFTIGLLFLGFTTFTMLFFTLTFKLPLMMNLHILLCTIGLQLFMVTGILMYSTLFGGSMFLNPDTRKFQHFILQGTAVLTGVAGFIVVYPKMICSEHALTGFFGVLFGVFASLLGPAAYFSSARSGLGKFNRRLHICFGLPSFILCSTCFITALLKPSFVKWLKTENGQYLLIAFTVFYSLCVIVSIYFKKKFYS